MIKHMHIELDSDTLFHRRFTFKSDVTHRPLGMYKHYKKGDTAVLRFCCNCFIEECTELGCIEQTSDGYCECGLDHSVLR